MAFNSVPHQRLIAKLEALGVCGNLSLWLSNFLSNRFQRVVSNSHMSCWAQVVSAWGSPGVYSWPFVVYILHVNNIPDLI